MEAGKRTDTIAAIATAVSSSGIGIVRVSGSQAISVVDQIFKSKNKGKRDPRARKRRAAGARDTSE